MSQRQLSDLNISQANKILCRKHLNSSIYILNYINKIRRYLKTYIYGQYTPNPSLSIVAHIPNSTGYSSARLPDEANLHYLEKGIPDTLTLILGRGFLKWCHALQDRRWSIISGCHLFVLKFGASMLKFATDRRSWLVKNINTEDLSAVAVSDKIPSKVRRYKLVHVSRRLSRCKTLLATKVLELRR